MVIISDKDYNDLLQKFHDNPKYKIPDEEKNVYFTRKDLATFRNTLTALLIDLINTQFQFVYQKPALITDNAFNVSKYKEIKTRISEFIQLHFFDLSFQSCKLSLDVVSGSTDKGKARDFLALATFYLNYFSGSFEYNKEIVNNFDDAISYYKKNKEDEILVCECMIRLATYYSYFPNMKEEFFTLINRIYHRAQTLRPEEKFEILLKMAWIFHELKLYRKEKYNYYLCSATCLNNTNEFSKLTPMIINIISKHFEIYSVDKTTIDSYERFCEVHKKFVQNIWKPYGYYLVQKSTASPGQKPMITLKEFFKKKIEKRATVKVQKHLENIMDIILKQKWFTLQQSIYLPVINYYNANKESAEGIPFELGYLQANYENLSESEQEGIMNEFLENSMKLQRKLYLSLVKMPCLVRLIPQVSPIRFDITKNPKYNKSEENKIFLYNPWENKGLLNYYWTVNNSQNISLQLFNPLSIEITISRIKILFRSENKEDNSEPSEPITYSPTVAISPKSSVNVLIQVVPIKHGVFDIIGITYDLMNIHTKQYVDSNGNGLFYQFENLFGDTGEIKSAGKKKKYVSLKQIQIYPEIPLIHLKNLDKSQINNIDDSITLYEFEHYNFKFLVENIGTYPIDSIKCNIYIYKEGDYKILFKELFFGKKEGEESSNDPPLIMPGKSMKLEYDYLHYKCNLKIEFRLYYVSNKMLNEDISKENILKPFALFDKEIKTEHLLIFSDLKILPKVSNLSVNELVLNYPPLKKYSNFVFNSNQFLLSFLLLNNSQKKIKYSISHKDKLIKDEIIESNSKIQVSFDCDINIDFNEVRINWRFLNRDDLKGEMSIAEAFKNQLDDNYNLHNSNDFKFEINVEKKEEESIIKYSIKNNSKEKTFKNLKLYYFLYQNIQDFVVYNEEKLRDILYYEGTLNFSYGGELKYEEEIFNEIKVYKFNEKEIINTTFAVVDSDAQKVYLCAIDKTI
ncbi:MAG: hypothetical protein MJ252_03150 [archaeon]|nr:hypothetical protein [archaeon]